VDGDYNFWYAPYLSTPFIVIVITSLVLNCINVGFILFRGYIHFYAYGVQVNIIFLCLIIEIIGNIERILFITVCQYYKPLVITYIVTEIGLFSTLPLSLISTILIAFYWAEIMSKTNVSRFKKGGSWLLKLKIPFIIITIVLVVVDITLSIIRTQVVTDLEYFITLKVTVIWYALLTFSINITFLIIGIKIIFFANKTNKVDVVKTEKENEKKKSKNKKIKTRLIN